MTAREACLWKAQAEVRRGLKWAIKAGERAWEPKARERARMAENHARYVLKSLRNAIADEVNR